MQLIMDNRGVVASDSLTLMLLLVPLDWYCTSVPSWTRLFHTSQPPLDLTIPVSQLPSALDAYTETCLLPPRSARLKTSPEPLELRTC